MPHNFHQLAKASSVPVRKGVGGSGNSERTSPGVGLPSRRLGGSGSNGRTSPSVNLTVQVGLGALEAMEGQPQEGISFGGKGLGVWEQ